MHLGALIDPELVFADLQSRDRSSLLRDLARRLVASGRFEDVEDLYTRLWEREKLGSTGIGDGVAVPHCKMDDLDNVVVSVARLSSGIDFDAIDDQPVRLVFLVISPEDQPAAHLQCLATISKWLKESRQVEQILELTEPQSIHALLSEGA